MKECAINNYTFELTNIKLLIKKTIMKKQLLIATAFILLCFVSCKKDYTCECTSKVDGATIGTTNTSIKATKKKASALCKSTEATSNGTSTVSTSQGTSTSAVTATTTCELK